MNFSHAPAVYSYYVPYVAPYVPPTVGSPGALFSWGYAGGYAHGNVAAKSTPVAVGSLNNWAQLSCLGNTAAIKNIAMRIHKIAHPSNLGFGLYL